MAENISKSNPWSALTTVSTFDKGSHSRSTCRVDELDVQGSGQIVGRVAPSTSLLIESLVKQLCTMFEGNADRRNKLFFAICDRLHEMKLIDGSYNLIEFEMMRGQYQIALYNLVTIARAATGSESPLQVPNCLMAECSRYHREFKEIGFIDAGGFGNVYKALHRLDGHEYAIKKIRVASGRVKTLMQHLKEVKTIARLNHTNIVSYKGAWIESCFSTTLVPSLPGDEISDREGSRVRQNRTKSTNSRSYYIHRYSNEKRPSRSPTTCESDSDSSGENFKASNSKKCTYSTGMYAIVDNSCVNNNFGSSGGYIISHDIINERFRQLNSTTNIIGERIAEPSSSRAVEDENSDIVSFRSDTKEKINNNNNGSDTDRSYLEEINADVDISESTSFDETVSERQIIQYKSSPSTAPQFATLYIQMGLCDQTLRQWIDEREEPPSIQLVSAIITQILSGLEYIHELGIVHHDVKPKNILIMGNLQIQLGDFGLACPLQRENHHTGCGTMTYAAPEQLRGICDPKSDVYSLGIVLLELLVPMKTNMERSKVIAALKSGQLPTALVTNYPRWAQIISQLVQVDPKCRPTTSELLQQLGEDKDLLIAKLKEEIVQQNVQIRELQDRIAQLEFEKLSRIGDSAAT